MWGKVGVSMAILVLACSAAAIFSFDLCDLVFQCGCDSVWGARATHCNIHVPDTRHCPWCTAEPPASYLIAAGLFLPPALASIFPWGWSWKRKLPSALVAVVAGALVTGLVSGLAVGYWA